MENNSWKVQAVEEMLGKCNNLYMPKNDNSLVIFMGATDPKYGGQGLSSSINIDLLKNAKNKDYK